MYSAEVWRWAASLESLKQFTGKLVCIIVLRWRKTSIQVCSVETRHPGKGVTPALPDLQECEENVRQPRSPPFLQFPPENAETHCIGMSLWMKPPWSPPFPALAGTDLVIKPGGCWPMWSPEFIIALCLKTIAYSGSTWEDTGPEGRTGLQLPVLLHAHPKSNEAAFSCDRLGPRWDAHSQALRKSLKERPSLPLLITVGLREAHR